jgi:hypothetical protein
LDDLFESLPPKLGALGEQEPVEVGSAVDEVQQVNQPADTAAVAA